LGKVPITLPVLSSERPLKAREGLLTGEISRQLISIDEDYRLYYEVLVRLGPALGDDEAAYRVTREALFEAYAHIQAASDALNEAAAAAKALSVARYDVRSGVPAGWRDRVLRQVASITGRDAGTLFLKGEPPALPGRPATFDISGTHLELTSCVNRQAHEGSSSNGLPEP
jgi:hypothetical protein